MAEVWALVYLLCCVLRQDTGYARKLDLPTFNRRLMLSNHMINTEHLNQVYMFAVRASEKPTGLGRPDRVYFIHYSFLEGW